MYLTNQKRIEMAPNLVPNYQVSYHNNNSNSMTYSEHHSDKYYNRNYINPNRRWIYTDNGKIFNENKKQNYSKRKLIKNDDHLSSFSSFSNDETSHLFDFKVCTYNLLAPDLLEKNYYLYRDMNYSHLDWNRRKIKIINEIKRLRSDVNIKRF
jgi:hypothetical protein